MKTRTKSQQEALWHIRVVHERMLPKYRELPEEERWQKFSHEEWRAAILLYVKTEGHYWPLLPDNYNCGRLLDVGCGSCCPAQHLRHTELWGIDPLIPFYLSAGFPMLEYGAVLLPFSAEDMWMVPDNFFDTIVTQNAIDHCDDFEQVCAEIERVAKPTATLRINVPYHEPTDTEPLQIDDERVLGAFHDFTLTKLIQYDRPTVSEALWGTE